MTLGGLLMVAMGLACGFLVWRGSGKVLNAILAGVFMPVFAILAAAILIGRENFESMNPIWLLPVAAVLIVIAAYFSRPRD